MLRARNGGRTTRVKVKNATLPAFLPSTLLHAFGSRMSAAILKASSPERAMARADILAGLPRCGRDFWSDRFQQRPPRGRAEHRSPRPSHTRKWRLSRPSSSLMLCAAFRLRSALHSLRYFPRRSAAPPPRSRTGPRTRPAPRADRPDRNGGEHRPVHHFRVRSSRFATRSAVLASAHRVRRAESALSIASPEEKLNPGAL